MKSNIEQALDNFQEFSNALEHTLMFYLDRLDYSNLKPATKDNQTIFDNDNKEFILDYKDNFVSLEHIMYNKVKQSDDYIYQCFQEYINQVNTYINDFQNDMKQLISNIDDKEQQEEMLKKLELINLERLNKKKYISVDEFKTLFGYSVTSQQNMRGRTHNPIPFIQEKLGSKITYEVELVKEWLDKYKKN